MFQATSNPFSSGSPLSQLLGQQPRTVAAPEPPPLEVPEPEPVPVTESQPSMLSGLFGGPSQPAEPERLTADEIRARAEVQTRTYGTIILLVNAVIECIKASLTLKKGEYATYLALKEEYDQNSKEGVTVLYEYDPTYKEIWLKGRKFEEALAEVESEHELDEAESKLLFKAIKADLERKNRKNELGDDSVMGTLLKLLVIRQVSSAFELITTVTRKRAQR